MDNFDLTLIANSLAQEKNDGAPSWLADSYRDPRWFWETLTRTPDPSSPLSRKSVAFKTYNMIHDALIRNRYTETPAFRWHDTTGWQEVSYAMLEADVNQRAEQWRQWGLKPEQILCILRLMGYPLLVSLLAGFKLGLIISLLPIGGREFLAKRLECLSPHYIDADAEAVLLLKPEQQRLVLAELSAVAVSAVSEIDGAESGVYSSESLAVLCFDPASITPHIPTALCSDALYLCALRDGLITLGLRRGDICAAPGFPLLQTQPCLLLSVLLTGATYLHLTPEDIQQNPALLTDYPLKAIGVTPQIRDCLLKQPILADEKWRFWFKDPAASDDYELWQNFVRALRLEGSWSGNLRWRAAIGGCALFSPRKKGAAHSLTLPIAGIKWGIGEALDEQNEMPAPTMGLFTCQPLGTSEIVNTTDLILRKKQGFQYLRSLISGRAGLFYPRTEVEECLRSTVSCFTIIEIPPLCGPEGDPLFILLIFTGGREEFDPAGLQKHCWEIIKTEMGSEFLPDQAVFSPLYPRCKSDGKPNVEWCKAEYLTGGLKRVAANPIFLRLAAVRAALYEQ